MINEYHRPSSLDEAMGLVSQPATVPLGGGTSFTGSPEAGPVAVVDLQSVGLSGIDADGATIVVGAMTRLQDVVDSPLVPVTIRDLVRREAPNTIRNAATLGGTIVTADSESELLAGPSKQRSPLHVRKDRSNTPSKTFSLIPACLTEGSSPRYRSLRAVRPRHIAPLAPRQIDRSSRSLPDDPTRGTFASQQAGSGLAPPLSTSTASTPSHRRVTFVDRLNIALA